MIFVIVCTLICVILDRITKMAAAASLGPGRSFTVFEGLLNFTYVENEGMAFGLLAEHRYIFMTLSVVLLIAMAVFIFWYRKQANAWLKLACGLIIGGGVGNMIDRISLGYVIDFIDVKLFDFWKWVFNLADAFVCIGVFMMAVYLIADSVKIKKEAKTAEQAQDEDDG